MQHEHRKIGNYMSLLMLGLIYVPVGLSDTQFCRHSPPSMQLILGISASPARHSRPLRTENPEKIYLRRSEGS